MKIHIEKYLETCPNKRLSSFFGAILSYTSPSATGFADIGIDHE
jgi:hypothetical protein